MKRKDFFKLLGVAGIGVTTAPTTLQPVPKKPDLVEPPPDPVQKPPEYGVKTIDYEWEYDVPRERWDEFHEALLTNGKVKVQGDWWLITNMETEADTIPVDGPGHYGDFGFQQHVQGPIRVTAHLRPAKPPKMFFRK